jgi:hypothetical protein
MVIPKPVIPGNIPNLQIFYQNIQGLGNKIDELNINWVNDVLHILCFTEHHLPMEVVQTIIIDNYNLGAYYCRKHIKCGVCIFTHKSYHFVTIDLDSRCIKQDFKVCAIKLSVAL